MDNPQGVMAPPSDKARLQCHVCSKLLEYDAGAQYVQCFQCRSMNSAPGMNGLGGKVLSVLCTVCNTPNLAPYGPSFVRCGHCGTVSNVSHAYVPQPPQPSQFKPPQAQPAMSPDTPHGQPHPSNLPPAQQPPPGATMREVSGAGGGAEPNPQSGGEHQTAPTAAS
eukprot:GHVN01027558.1.p1 GENE.GHVN01027558.1~~GHVN01027558.1.p1  ORF type:complete len:166 (+),score=33.76 GHVN01027558.1:114-611(+)